MYGRNKKAMGSRLSTQNKKTPKTSARTQFAVDREGRLSARSYGTGTTDTYYATGSSIEGCGSIHQYEPHHSHCSGSEHVHTDHHHCGTNDVSSHPH